MTTLNFSVDAGATADDGSNVNLTIPTTLELCGDVTSRVKVCDRDSNMAVNGISASPTSEYRGRIGSENGSPILKCYKILAHQLVIRVK